MGLILNIHTALETASVCLSDRETVVEYADNNKQQDHAAWMHPAIRELLRKGNTLTNQLDAVAVTIGPGSYTGLRVGLSAAKGFCYALNIPLITVGTLPLIAMAAREEASSLICPLIDARRMEVFTAMYTKDLEEIMSPVSMILDQQSFAEELSGNEILFCGNGNKKLKELLSQPNVKYSDIEMTAKHLALKSYQFYREKKFSDLAYTEPLYIKEFYTPARKLS
jgi:tRNA threonylcarbamoyladenosine biosynthesis protein TsaB